MYRLLIGLLALLPLSAFAGGLVGLAYVDNMVGMNLEWAMSHSSVYVVPGTRFTQGSGGAEHNLRWVAGIRHRLQDDNGGSDSMNDSGFFLGLIGGDVGGTPTYRRNGYGGELGYQLVRKNTRWTVSGALVALSPDSQRGFSAEPGVVLGVSLSLRK